MARSSVANVANGITRVKADPWRRSAPQLAYHLADPVALGIDDEQDAAAFAGKPQAAQRGGGEQLASKPCPMATSPTEWDNTTDCDLQAGTELPHPAIV